jgi:hypothetical protein
VRLAVRYVENTIAVNEHAVRPRQRASKWIGLGTVTSATGADDCCDDAAIERDSANHMALSIGHIELVAPMGQSLGTRELSKASRAAIPRITLLAGASQVMNCSGCAAV